eukprot:TRINITY_DN65622_c0_g3_i2.p1 TRINITY_DN65622_c0_g3~~TRINITY_DN65622_c0_g3_i2.p1  ORF type:complete len:230 (-),score=87.40 TRINITY_DN65622_c0_g3_i2:146-835(-)
MSKVNSDVLSRALDNILTFSSGKDIEMDGETLKGKKRNFVETVELQVTLKQLDPAKDKRFAGSFQLPNPTRSKINVCVFVNDKHEQICKKEGIPYMTVDDVTNLNRNKKLIRAMAKKYDAFLASDTLMKKLPRLLGPGLNRAGKFPSVLNGNDDPKEKIQNILCTVKFQMKKVLVLNVAVGHVQLEKDQLKSNIVLSINFLISLLKKKWQNVKVIYIKSTMGPAQLIYF